MREIQQVQVVLPWLQEREFNGRMHGVRQMLRLAGLVVCVWFSAVCGYGQTTNVFYLQGLADYDQTNWTGAITNFSRAIQENYDLWDAYSYCAYARACIEDKPGALADCQQLIQLNPHAAEGYFWRARVNDYLHDYEAELADYEMGCKINLRAAPVDLREGLHWVFSQRASDKFQNNDLAGAYADLATVIRIDPGSAHSSYSLSAWIRVIQGHFDEAIALADKGLQLKQQSTSTANIRVLEIRAWARLGRGDVAGAAEDCDRVVDFEASNPKCPSEFLAEVEGVAVLPSRGLRKSSNEVERSTGRLS